MEAKEAKFSEVSERYLYCPYNNCERRISDLKHHHLGCFFTGMTITCPHCKQEIKLSGLLPD